MKKNIVAASFVLLFAIFLHASPYRSTDGVKGHKAYFKELFGDLYGRNLDGLYSSVSKGIDIDFPASVKSSSGMPLHANHRYLGHWGFEGSIPFDREDYREILAQYRRKDIKNAWKAFVKAQTDRAVELTGLPEKQARAFAGLLYDDHILVDWMPGNTITAPLSPVKDIQKDIAKNLQRLFGKHSPYVRDVERALKTAIFQNAGRMPEEACRQSAWKMLEVLRKYKLGDRLFNVYGKQLQAKGIVPRIIKPLASLMNEPVVLSERQAAAYLLEVQKRGRIGIKPDRIARLNGLLSPTGDMIVLRPLLAAKEGFTAAATVFITESGDAAYRNIRGETRMWELQEAIKEAAVKGLFVGGAVGVTILLGATPQGLCVLAVSIGAYLVIDCAVAIWNEHQDGKYLTMDDLRGFGITADTPLEVRPESLLHMPPDTPLDVTPETPLDL